MSKGGGGSQQQKGFLKLIIIGDSGVGKTSVLEAFNYKKISKTAKPTIGAEFTKKKIRLDSGEEVNLQIWDTAGQERFQSLCSSFYRGSDGCILVFDISNAESYDNLEKWRQVFISTTGDDSKQIPIILVANKVDCINTIHKDQIDQEWIQTQKAKVYIEASALKHQGIEETFMSAAREAQNYQASLRSNISDAFKHSIINIQQLRQGQRASEMQKSGAAGRGLANAGRRQCNC